MAAAMVSKQEFDLLKSNSDQGFLIFMGTIIFLMQAGFAFLEAGSVRSKNTTNILLKNVLDVFIGCISYFLFGFAFAFGNPGNEFIGHNYFALADLPPALYSKWFFQFVFAATAATIVSGAMAERTDFKAYLIYSVFITGFSYPVVTHWAWDSAGWLAVGMTYTSGNQTYSVAYQDFAGSGVVHVVGGASALIGAITVGPRIGRFEKGQAKVIPGHTVPQAALGGFILFFGFLAFNGGSQAAIANPGDPEAVAKAIVNTCLSGAGGAITAMLIKRIGYAEKHWSLLVTINGALTGMVAICAGCNTVHPYAAFIIGLIGGVTFMVWSKGLLRFGIDDPIDAVAVHMGGGLWGVFSVVLFNHDSGVFYDNFSQHSWTLFAWNLAGVLAITAWSMATAFMLFFPMRMLGVLRVSAEIEIKGMDIPKHGEPAYPPASYGNGWAEENGGPGVPVSNSDTQLKMAEEGQNKNNGVIANPNTEKPEAEKPTERGHVNEMELSKVDID